MTCKDCIHYDVCEDNLKYIQERFLKGLTFGKSEFTEGKFVIFSRTNHALLNCLARLVIQYIIRGYMTDNAV